MEHKRGFNLLCAFKQAFCGHVCAVSVTTCNESGLVMCFLQDMFFLWGPVE
jgi:hypothetical protein